MQIYWKVGSDLSPSNSINLAAGATPLSPAPASNSLLFTFAGLFVKCISAMFAMACSSHCHTKAHSLEHNRQAPSRKITCNCLQCITVVIIYSEQLMLQQTTANNEAMTLEWEHAVGFMWVTLPAYGAAAYIPSIVMERPLFVRFALLLNLRCF